MQAALMLAIVLGVVTLTGDRTAVAAAAAGCGRVNDQSVWMICRRSPDRR